MSKTDRKILKTRLINARVRAAKESRELLNKGNLSAAYLAHERWKILNRAANAVDDFDFKE